MINNFSAKKNKIYQISNLKLFSLERNKFYLKRLSILYFYRRKCNHFEQEIFKV